MGWGFWIAPAPCFVAAAAGAVDHITGETGVSLILLVAGIGGALALAWRARGEKDRFIARLRALEVANRALERSNRVLALRIANLACVREAGGACPGG